MLYNNWLYTFKDITQLNQKKFNAYLAIIKLIIYSYKSRKNDDPHSFNAIGHASSPS